MSVLEQLKAQAAAIAETGPDMTEATAGGGGAKLLPEGYAFGRFVEYIELGNHPQEFQGKAKPAAPEFQVGFALWGQGYQEDDGSPYIIRPYSIKMDRNEKSTAFKLFKALNWKGTYTHFAQLLGEAYLVKIVHVPKSKADQTIVSRVDLAGFLPPLDPVTKAPYPIPEAPDSAYRLFSWDHPTKEAWDALFIDGTYEAKDGKPARSKNLIQETIVSALNFEGSALQQLLLGAGAAIPQVAPTSTTPAVPSVAPAVPSTAGAAAPLAVPSQQVIAPSVASAPVIPATPTMASHAVQSAPQQIAPSNAPAVPVVPVVPSLPTIPAVPVVPA